ncbi:MAG: hypothetical protein ABFD61_00075 [Chloroherpetonaceae bacterium]
MMNQRKLIFILFLLPVSIFLNSCNEGPTEIGYNFLQDTTLIKKITSDDTTLIYKVESKMHSTCLFNTGGMFVGKSHNITGISIIRFADIPDTLSYLQESDIQSLTLYLYPQRYALGDTVNGSNNFIIKKVNTPWTAAANWDSINTPNFMDYQIASYNQKITLEDTMAIIIIDLDKKIIPEWFQLQPDTNIAIVNYGIALIPDDNSTIINTFGAEGINVEESLKSPSLRIIYKDKNKNYEIDTLYLSSGINATFFKPDDYDKNDVVIQGGLNLQSDFYFDVSMLPPFSGINKVQLELTLNPSKTYSGNLGQSKTIMLSYVNDTLNPASNYYYYAEPSDSNSTTYIAQSITSAVQLWNRGKGKGILSLSPSDFNEQYQKLDRLVFYGINDPDSTKRPKVKIFYNVIK